MVRGLTPERSDSASWVKPAARRCSRSTLPNVASSRGTDIVLLSKSTSPFSRSASECTTCGAHQLPGRLSSSDAMPAVAPRSALVNNEPGVDLREHLVQAHHLTGGVRIVKLGLRDLLSQ